MTILLLLQKSSRFSVLWITDCFCYLSALQLGLLSCMYKANIWRLNSSFFFPTRRTETSCLPESPGHHLVSQVSAFSWTSCCSQAARTFVYIQVFLYGGNSFLLSSSSLSRLHKKEPRFAELTSILFCNVDEINWCWHEIFSGLYDKCCMGKKSYGSMSSEDTHTFLSRACLYL